MKLPKLNARGAAHLLIPLVIIVGVAVGGTAYLVASRADTCPPASGISATSGTTCPPTSGTSGVSAPSDGRKYSTLLSQTTFGKVYGCIGGSSMYLRIVSNTGTFVAYSQDGGTATNLKVPADSAVYRHVALNASGRTFAAQLANHKLTVTTVDGWTVGGIGQCN